MTLVLDLALCGKDMRKRQFIVSPMPICQVTGTVVLTSFHTTSLAE